MKRFIFGFTVCALALLVMGAAATRNRYVGVFVGDGAGVSNAVAGSGAATYVTSATLTNKTYASNLVGSVAVTTTNTLTSLTVQGAEGTDAIVAAVRHATGASNDVLQVQNTSNGFLFGVTTNGVARGGGFVVRSNAMANWPTAPRYHGEAIFVNSNGFVYLLTSGVGLTWTATNKIAP